MPARPARLVVAALALGAGFLPARGARAADAPAPVPAPAPADDPTAAVEAIVRAWGTRSSAPDAAPSSVLWTRWGFSAVDPALTGELAGLVERLRSTAAGVFPEVGRVEGTAPHRRVAADVRVSRDVFRVLFVEADGWQAVRADRVRERGLSAVAPAALRAAAEGVMAAVDTRDAAGFARRSAQRKDGALVAVDAKAVEAMVGELHEKYGARSRVLLWAEVPADAVRAVATVVVDREDVLELELEKDAEGLWRLVGLGEGDAAALDEASRGGPPAQPPTPTPTPKGDAPAPGR